MTSAYSASRSNVNGPALPELKVDSSMAPSTASSDSDWKARWNPTAANGGESAC